MVNLIASALLAATTANAPQPNLIGYIPVTIKQGTNVVENLPATATYQPELRSFAEAKPGDVVVWKGETHTFDGKAWSGKGGGEAKVPIPEKFTVVRTAKETSVWNLGVEINLKKAEKMGAGTARDNKRKTTSKAGAK